MKNTTKTFYTVTFATLGTDNLSKAYFDNKEEAERFSAQDCSDNVVTHRVSRPEAIARYEEGVAMTAMQE